MVLGWFFFNVPGWFFMVFMVPGWFFMVLMVPGWFLKVFLQNVPAPTVSLPNNPVQVRRPQGSKGPSIEKHKTKILIYRVEQCFSPHCDVEGDVEVGFVTTGVELYVPDDDAYQLGTHE